MKYKVSGNVIMLTCIVLMLVIALVLYPSLPEELPRQWGFDGQVNSTWDKFYAVLFAPFVSVLLWVFTYVMPRIDPRRESYEKFSGFYMRFRVALVVFFLGMQIITLTQYNNPDAVIRLIIFAVAAILTLLGNEMGRIRPTWFFGIRTPWTLSDERVWKKTHRVGGRWFVGLGILNMVAAILFLVPVMAIGFFFIISSVAVSLGLTVYSYILYRRLNG